jgi:hypothetical protein
MLFKDFKILARFATERGIFNGKETGYKNGLKKI